MYHYTQTRFSVWFWSKKLHSLVILSDDRVILSLAFEHTKLVRVLGYITGQKKIIEVKWNDGNYYNYLDVKLILYKQPSIDIWFKGIRIWKLYQFLPNDSLTLSEKSVFCMRVNSDLCNPISGDWLNLNTKCIIL